MMLSRLFSACVLMLCLTVPAYAQLNATDMQNQLQQLQSMSPEQQEAFMQKMMGHAEQAQQCIEKAGGDAAVKELEELYHAHEQQIAALCNNNEREQAQAYAQNVAMELAQDQRVMQMQNCTSSIAAEFQQFSQFSQPASDETGATSAPHICDATK